MAVKLSPWGNSQFTTETGAPASGWKVYAYAAGSSTPLATYTDNTGGVAQTNPIVLNTLGFPTTGQIWLTSGLAYKLVLTDSSGTVKKTEDNISGVNDTSTSVSQWITSGLTPTYVSTTSFTLAGDQTSEFHQYRRLQFTTSGGTVYGTISVTAYTALTTVTVVMDGAQVLDAGLSAVNLSILRADNLATPTNILAGGTSGQSLRSKGAVVAPVWSSPGQIQPITASVGSNNLTVTLNPTVLEFRSNPLTSGTVNLRDVAAAISVVVPSSGTLGTINATQSRIVVLAIDNAGTVELAVVNIAGGTNLDETTLISTTAISAAATSSSVIYSTTARTNVAYRVIGYVESTQATAGTWVTAPSTIQGYGGQALAAMSSLGYGQTWTSVTRNASTNYYNTTGRPIAFTAYMAGSLSNTFLINGVTVQQTVTAAANAQAPFIIIPPGAMYSYTGTFSLVFELR